MTPKRIQLSRQKGWRKPEGAIVVARPSRWGNPYVVGSGEVTWSGSQLGLGAGFYDPEDVRWSDSAQVRPRAGLTAAEAVYRYRYDLVDSLTDSDWEFDELRAALAKLRGYDLACWCPLVDENGEPVSCHADVLLELSNKGES